MSDDIALDTAEKLFTILPLIFRSTRRKIIKKLSLDFEENISPIQIEIMKLLQEVDSLNISEIGDRLQIADSINSFDRQIGILGYGGKRTK